MMDRNRNPVWCTPFECTVIVMQCTLNICLFIIWVPNTSRTYFSTISSLFVSSSTDPFPQESTASIASCLRCFQGTFSTWFQWAALPSTSQSPEKMHPGHGVPIRRRAKAGHKSNQSLPWNPCGCSETLCPVRCLYGRTQGFGLCVSKTGVKRRTRSTPAALLTDRNCGSWCWTRQGFPMAQQQMNIV